MKEKKETKQRGRPKAIESPEKMWEYFQQYVEKIKNNPYLVKDYVGKDVVQVHREIEKPLTMMGFTNHLYDLGIITDVSDYFENTNGTYGDFLHVCTRIRSNIKEDQISGGMAGLFNASITQRLNSLSDNVAQTLKGDKNNPIEIIDKSDRSELIKELLSKRK